MSQVAQKNIRKKSDLPKRVAPAFSGNGHWVVLLVSRVLTGPSDIQ
jgi:hypothetical protein